MNLQPLAAGGFDSVWVLLAALKRDFLLVLDTLKEVPGAAAYFHTLFTVLDVQQGKVVLPFARHVIPL